MNSRTAVIIGAGPAGLTAAYEMATRTDIHPIVIEQSSIVGGLSRTYRFGGNRIDVGPHRFFSKSDRVLDWWYRFLPRVSPENSTSDQVMLIRSRKTRILFEGCLYDYPISLSAKTLRQLGARRILRIGMSYVRSLIRPRKPQITLEDFFINRFGYELYRTFFKSYTEKVWGMECRKIDAEWGAQRVKGLDIPKAILHFARHCICRNRSDDSETSLIEQFLYPKLGAGQMWETVAACAEQAGAEILLNHKVTRVRIDGSRVVDVDVANDQDGSVRTISADIVLSSMAVSDLIRAMSPPPAQEIRDIAENLPYRDTIIVAILLKKLKLSNQTAAGDISDNWIYLQDRDLKATRMQICNNMSPYLVADPANILVGFEYSCSEKDEIWSQSDEQIASFATKELAAANILDAQDIIELHVMKIPRTYPAYWGSYAKFPIIREAIDQIENLFPIGRNGMHKYNNQDHSMLTAMASVDLIIGGQSGKSEIWQVNAQDDYHEAKN